jgi:hypothetical protein
LKIVLKQREVVVENHWHWLLLCVIQVGSTLYAYTWNIYWFPPKEDYENPSQEALDALKKLKIDKLFAAGIKARPIEIKVVSKDTSQRYVLLSAPDTFVSSSRVVGYLSSSGFVPNVHWRHITANSGSKHIAKIWVTEQVGKSEKEKHWVACDILWREYLSDTSTDSSDIYIFRRGPGDFVASIWSSTSF